DMIRLGGKQLHPAAQIAWVNEGVEVAFQRALRRRCGRRRRGGYACAKDECGQEPYDSAHRTRLSLSCPGIYSAFSNIVTEYGSLCCRAGGGQVHAGLRL